MQFALHDIKAARVGGVASQSVSNLRFQLASIHHCLLAQFEMHSIEVLGGPFCPLPKPPCDLAAKATLKNKCVPNGF